MRAITDIKEMQHIALDVLIYLDKVCSKYDRLADVIRQDGEKKYKFCTPQNTKKFIYPFGKLIDVRTGLLDDTSAKCEIGVHIDVFPYDGLPGDSEPEYRKFAKRCVYLAEQRYPAFTTWKQAKERTDKGHFYFAKWVMRWL